MREMSSSKEIFGYTRRARILSKLSTVSFDAGRPPEKNFGNPPAFTIHDAATEEFSPPEVNWRDALDSMKREIRKIQNLPTIENALESTPAHLRSSLEIRQKYFNRKSEEIIRKARGSLDPGLELLITTSPKTEKIHCADALSIHEENIDFANEFILDYILVFASYTIHEEELYLITKQNPPKIFKFKPPIRNKNSSSSASDWRLELKKRDKAKEKKSLEALEIGVPEYRPPERVTSVVVDWRDLVKEQLKNPTKRENPFEKWKTIDSRNSQSLNKSNTLKPPKQKPQFTVESSKSLFGPKAKLKPPNKLSKSTPSKKMTTKIINFVSISVCEVEDVKIHEGNSPEPDQKPTKPLFTPTLNPEILESPSCLDENSTKEESIEEFLETNKDTNENLEVKVEETEHECPKVESSGSSYSTDFTYRNYDFEVKVKPFKFSEEKRNFVKEKFFLGNVYIGSNESEAESLRTDNFVTPPDSASSNWRLKFDHKMIDKARKESVTDIKKAVAMDTICEALDKRAVSNHPLLSFI